jgi:hypothetical protein
MALSNDFLTKSVNSLDEIPIHQDSPTIYRVKLLDDIKFSLLTKIQPKADFLLVLFNAAQKSKSERNPTFMRWSWAEKANFSYIVIDDPFASSFTSTNIGWYIGLKDFDLQKYICSFAESVIKRIGITTNELIFYGSSGGGFAALMAAIRMKGSTAVVHNPQTNVLRYSKRLRTNFIDIFGEDESIIKQFFYHRFSVNEAMDYYNNAPNVLYRQNTQDLSHLNQHLGPFNKHYHKIIKQQDLDKSSFNVIMYDDPKGHSSVATYEEFISDIKKAND